MKSGGLTAAGAGAEPSLAEAATRSTISADEIAKIRLWHLLAQAQQIFRQTMFADTKAATLLALAGLIAARVAVSVPADRVDAFIALVFLNKAAVLIACLAVIMPRYPNREGWAALAGRERFSWAALANPMADDGDYGAFGKGAEADEICASIARANADSAKVLARKFRRLRFAFQLAILDVVLTIGVFLARGL